MSKLILIAMTFIGFSSPQLFADVYFAELAEIEAMTLRECQRQLKDAIADTEKLGYRVTNVEKCRGESGKYAASFHCHPR